MSHIKAASSKSLACASIREKKKDKKYSKVVQENHGSFYPLVAEKYGGFGNKFTKLIKMLQTDATDHHQLSEQESQAWLHKAKCSIAVALQLGNAIMSNRLMRKAFTRKRRGNDQVQELLQSSRAAEHSMLYEDLEETQGRELTEQQEQA